MNINEEKLLTAQIIPPVTELKLVSDDVLLLKPGVRFTVKGGEETALMDDAQRSWGISPHFEILPADPELKPEAYRIEIDSTGVSISASTPVGARHAFKTLRQLAEAERGIAKSMQYCLPAVRITDEPELAFRGIHLCWFPETPVWEIEKEIRLAAYYKFNHIVLESWGVFRLESFPEFVWEEFAVEQSEVKRLIRLAESLGVTIFPQVNLFGHATASRTSSGKHVLLDFHPEFASLFEPDGWTWCLSNPATRKYLTEVVVELHALFNNPPFFHIGCDEAYHPASCIRCRRADYKALLKEHLLYFYDLLKQRGAQTLMWHDMLIAREDERWKGYTAYGREKNGLSELYKELPKDILICDWQYGYPEIDGNPPSWPTLKFFKENGFEVLACPWLNPEGMASLGRFAVQENLAGILETSWHRNHSNNMLTVFRMGAKTAWAPTQQDLSGFDYRQFLNRHVREIGQDMQINQYIQAGTIPYQINIHDNPE